MPTASPMPTTDVPTRPPACGSTGRAVRSTLMPMVSSARRTCARTVPYGEPVDATGCRPRLAVSQQYTLLLTFENDSATIIGDARAALAEVAALITQYPETTVSIEGHTDDRGPARYNMRMSKQRADAVAKVLINDLGIDASRVTSVGFGETKPIATNATKEGRARNRRVVAVVLPATDPHAAPMPHQSKRPTRNERNCAQRERPKPATTAGDCRPSRSEFWVCRSSVSR